MAAGTSTDFWDQGVHDNGQDCQNGTKKIFVLSEEPRLWEYLPTALGTARDCIKMDVSRVDLIQPVATVILFKRKFRITKMSKIKHWPYPSSQGCREIYRLLRPGTV